MIGRTSPREAGLEEKWIRRFLYKMQYEGVNLHSVLLLRGNDIFFEKYWAPFDADKIHRMYSVTKSFVSMAVGCLIDEGKIALSDPIVKFFPDKLPENVPEFMQEQTIEHMLMMSTCQADGHSWFTPGVYDRTKFYFAQKPDKPAGTNFHYDSNGSYILGALVERISGMKLLDYMKEKFLNRIGGFESAQMLETPDGVAWGDSALLCTPRALMNFAKLVMNLGAWDGEQLISRDYVANAISVKTTNNLEGSVHRNRYGYGYQIWRTNENSFSFNGMGSQFAICVPDKDFIFVCTADTQLNSEVDNPAIFRAVFDELVHHLDGEEEHFNYDLQSEAQLSVSLGEKESAFQQEVNGATFRCDENPMGIKWFRLSWDEKNQGCFIYENAQGEKKLPFGMKENIFCKFPQLGYSNDNGNVHELNGFMYDCAVSAGWVEPQKLQLRVQIVDRYFGILIITFGFRKDGVVGVKMMKRAEDFLTEYNGWMSGRKA
ncbi:MAG: serine hydrolase [Clostridia bacterium]|nr:serine hydrolase [Clostridia bacterium]